MKQLITKSDGTPTKSKVHALQTLDKLGIDRSLLIEENGQFYYNSDSSFDSPEDKATETEEPQAEAPKETEKTEEITVKAVEVKYVTWETPIYNKNNEKTVLYIPGTDVTAIINGKHPAGQNRNKSAFEISVNGENFIMSVDLICRIFRVREV